MLILKFQGYRKQVKFQFTLTDKIRKKIRKITEKIDEEINNNNYYYYYYFYMFLV